MPLFQYEAIDAAGNSVKNTIQADSRDAVIAKLREQRYQPVRIEVAREGAGSKFADLNKRMQSVGTKELVVFTRQWATMQGAGLAILRTLDILAVQQKNTFFREAIEQIRSDISSGVNLPDALGRHPRIFDDLFVNMIRAGDIGGILDTILQRIAGYLEYEQEIRTKVKSAMMYPCVVFSFALLMTVAIVFFVLPRFKEIFDGMLGEDYKLPLVTSLLLNSSQVAKVYWWVPLVILAGAITTWCVVGRTESGRYRLDKLKLRIPVIGDLLLKLSTARVSRTLGTLQASGIPILQALEIVERTAGNAVVAKALSDTRAAVQEGRRMCEPLQESGVFPLLVTQMVQVGEEVGQIEEMLEKVANFYDEEVDATIKGLTSLIEPLMIIGLGGFVMFVCVAVIQPIYGALQRMQEQ